GVGPVLSASITVTPGVADHLHYTSQPADASAGVALSPAVAVAVVDSNDNVLTTDNSDHVTLSLASGSVGGTLGGIVSATTANGVATFSNLSLTRAGLYTLRAASPNF